MLHIQNRTHHLPTFGGFIYRFNTQSPGRIASYLTDFDTIPEKIAPDLAHEPLGSSEIILVIEHQNANRLVRLREQDKMVLLLYNKMHGLCRDGVTRKKPDRYGGPDFVPLEHILSCATEAANNHMRTWSSLIQEALSALGIEKPDALVNIFFYYARQLRQLEKENRGRNVSDRPRVRIIRDPAKKPDWIAALPPRRREFALPTGIPQPGTAPANQDGLK